MKKYLIIILAVVAISAITLSAYFTNTYYHYKSLQSEVSKYPSTYFIEPSSVLFVECYTVDDCIKVKGSACPPQKGGIEICINKNYMQQYLSSIETLSGKEWEVKCPSMDNSTNKECSCNNNTCKLVSQ